MKAPLPAHEAERLEALRRYEILDTLPEKAFDDLTHLAAYICKTPIALISLIDSDRQWFKSKIGLPVDETPREFAFCAHAILNPANVLVVPNASTDQRFADNPLVTSDPNIRFYAGAPLVTPQGYSLGTLCAIDRVPRELNPEQIEALEALSRQVVAQLELRLDMKTLEKRAIELKKAKEVAEAATNMKSEFCATMSHEIRTPMNGILGMTQLIANTDLSPTQRKYVETLRVSAEALLGIINNILDFSKIESGKMELEEHVFDLRKCIQDVLDLFSPRADEKKIALHCDLHSEVPQTVAADSMRLRQVLANLVGNALKFTDTGEIRVSVVNVKKDKEALWLRFSVQDTGIGIPADKINRLFHSFSQADSSTTRKYGGTGLGLVICSKLVHLMGGEISVESVEGKGSTFSFTMKAAPRATPATRVESAARDSESAQRVPLRILVVEDNLINQEVALGLLSQIGYTADIAADGAEALEQLRKKPYDLIFMDLQMPNVDGFETTRRIVSQWKNEKPKIAAMTANAISGEKEKCLAAGMDDYISKPVILSEIKRVIKGTAPAVNKRLDPNKRSEALARPLLDEARMAELKELSRRVKSFSLEKMIKLFEEASSLIHQMRTFVQSNASEKVKEPAHQLKGASLNLGAGQVARICEMIEESVQRGASVDVNLLLDDLEASYKRTLAELKRNG